MLSLWWQKQMGGRPTSTSMLVKESLGVLVDQVLKHHPDILVDSQQEAYEVIEQAMLNAKSARATRALGRGLQQEEITVGTGFDKYDKQSSNDIVQQAIKLMQERGDTEQEIVMATAKMMKLHEIRDEEARQEKAAQQQETIRKYSENKLQQATTTASNQLSDAEKERNITTAHIALVLEEKLKESRKGWSWADAAEWLKPQATRNFAKVKMEVSVEDKLAEIMDDAIDQYNKIDLEKHNKEKQARLARQLAEQTARKSAALDANSSDFMAQYEAREKDKLSKLKTELAKPPVRQAS